LKHHPKGLLPTTKQKKTLLASAIVALFCWLKFFTSKTNCKQIMKTSMISPSFPLVFVALASSATAFVAPATVRVSSSSSSSRTQMYYTHNEDNLAEQALARVGALQPPPPPAPAGSSIAEQTLAALGVPPLKPQPRPEPTYYSSRTAPPTAARPAAARPATATNSAEALEEVSELLGVYFSEKQAAPAAPTRTSVPPPPPQRPTTVSTPRPAVVQAPPKQPMSLDVVRVSARSARPQSVAAAAPVSAEPTFQQAASDGWKDVPSGPSGPLEAVKVHPQAQMPQQGY
jgi:hypothetical protein